MFTNFVDRVVGAFVPIHQVEARLKAEYENFERAQAFKTKEDHVVLLIDLLHGRASGLIAHISIMTAIVF